MLTGLSRDIARFQMRSAFFGVGYTTAEAETIVNHPVRRKIVQMLLVAGAIGISGVVGSSILTLARREDSILAPLLGSSSRRCCSGPRCRSSRWTGC